MDFNNQNPGFFGSNNDFVGFIGGGGDGGGVRGESSNEGGGDFRQEMYKALGNYNAQLKQDEARILAEEDVIDHLNTLKKDLQEEFNVLVQQSGESQLKCQLEKSELDKAKILKESLQKEVNEHKERVMEIKAYLEKKSRQIEKMKMEKQIKRKQFSELFQKRQEFIDSTPSGLARLQAKEKLLKLTEEETFKQSALEKKHSELSALQSTSNEKWKEFTKDCISLAKRWKERSIKKDRPTAVTDPNVPKGSAFSWSELYKKVSNIGSGISSGAKNTKRVTSTLRCSTLAERRSRQISDSLNELQNLLKATENLTAAMKNNSSCENETLNSTRENIDDTVMQDLSCTTFHENQPTATYHQSSPIPANQNFAGNVQNLNLSDTISSLPKGGDEPGNEILNANAIGENIDDTVMQDSSCTTFNENQPTTTTYHQPSPIPANRNFEGNVQNFNLSDTFSSLPRGDKPGNEILNSTATGQNVDDTAMQDSSCTTFNDNQPTTTYHQPTTTTYHQPTTTTYHQPSPIPANQNFAGNVQNLNLFDAFSSPGGVAPSNTNPNAGAADDDFFSSMFSANANPWSAPRPGGSLF